MYKLYLAPKLERSDSPSAKISRLEERNGHIPMDIGQADFRSIYETHMKTIYRYCVFRTNSYQDAEDITAEVFIKFLENKHKVKQGLVLPWLYAVAESSVNLAPRTRRALSLRLPRLIKT